MTDFIVSQGNAPTTVTTVNNVSTVYSSDASKITVLTSSSQGPPGIQGPPGPIGDAFQIMNKFSELDTEQKKADARTNLELQNIDCGTFN